ncbi:MAG: hypothetical protein U1D06_09455 [Paracoccaceae bacterium]|nr:hypothetical protein [Paracoccaceae bacterium]
MNDFAFGAFRRRPEAASVLSLVVVIAFFVVFGGVQLGNLCGTATWVNFAASLGIVAIPVGMLMIAGKLDISIGVMIPAGLINGILTVRTSVASLIITLATGPGRRPHGIRL